MANEFRITNQFSYASVNDSVSHRVSFSADQTTTPGGGGPGVQVIGTTAEALTADGVTTPGWAWFKNLDDTNFVELGDNSGGFIAFAKLLPGECVVMRLAGTITLAAKADTADVRLQAEIFEA